MKHKTTIILGPPGTGKTTTLLNEVDKALESGVNPERIAYLSFTRKASEEAISRAKLKFPNLDAKRFKYFRTIHSLAYMLLGISPEQVMRQKDYDVVAGKLGMKINLARSVNQDQESKHTAGDKCLRAYSLHRATGKPVEEVFKALDTEYQRECTVGKVLAFIQTLDAFKSQFNLLDFNDFIENCKKKIDVDLFIVDEAQDLTKSQWDFIFRVVGEDCKKIIIAGDDDQAIYSWSGADVKDFMAVKGTKEVLPVSYRLPVSVFEISNNFIKKIRGRISKDWHPHKKEKGLARYINSIKRVNLEDGQEWLLLARTNYFLYEFVRHCRDRGVIYNMYGSWSNQTDDIQAVLCYEHIRSGKEISFDQLKLILKYVKEAPKVRRKNGGYKYNDVDWPWSGTPDWRGVLNIKDKERQYISAIRSKGNSLTKPGKVKISTIHGVKGGECDNVIINLKLGARIEQEIKKDASLRDDEIRVFYVGMTRAKNSLYLLGRQNFLQEL